MAHFGTDTKWNKLSFTLFNSFNSLHCDCCKCLFSLGLFCRRFASFSFPKRIHVLFEKPFFSFLKIVYLPCQMPIWFDCVSPVRVHSFLSGELLHTQLLSMRRNIEYWRPTAEYILPTQISFEWKRRKPYTGDQSSFNEWMNECAGERINFPTLTAQSSRKYSLPPSLATNWTLVSFGGSLVTWLHSPMYRHVAHTHCPVSAPVHQNSQVS